MNKQVMIEHDRTENPGLGEYDAYSRRKSKTRKHEEYINKRIREQ